MIRKNKANGVRRLAWTCLFALWSGIPAHTASNRDRNEVPHPADTYLPFIQDDFAPWLYSTQIFFNTTSTGANVPGNVTAFPMLVRLDSNNFLFAQAQSRSEEHTSNSSHVKISYAVFCLKKK